MRLTQAMRPNISSTFLPHGASGPGRFSGAPCRRSAGRRSETEGSGAGTSRSGRQICLATTKRRKHMNRVCHVPDHHPFPHERLPSGGAWHAFRCPAISNRRKSPFRVHRTCFAVYQRKPLSAHTHPQFSSGTIVTICKYYLARKRGFSRKTSGVRVNP